jgi:hypothetical protein
MVNYAEKEYDLKKLKEYLQFEKPNCVCGYEKSFCFMYTVFKFYDDKIKIPTKKRRIRTCSYYEQNPDIVMKLGIILGSLKYKKCVRTYIETFFDIEENDFDTFLLNMAKIITILDIMVNIKETDKNKKCKDLKHIEEFYNLFWKFLLDLLVFVF